MPLTEDQMQLLGNAISTLLGIGGTMGTQYVLKRKSKQEEDTDATKTLNDAAKENILTTQSVVNMLQEMLTDQQNYFTAQLGRVEQGFEKKANDLTAYGEKLKNENENLYNENGRLGRENTSLSIKLAGAITDVDVLTNRCDDLQKRLSKYENEITGDHILVMKQSQEKFKKERKKQEDIINGENSE